MQTNDGFSQLEIDFWHAQNTSSRPEIQTYLSHCTIDRVIIHHASFPSKSNRFRYPNIVQGCHVILFLYYLSSKSTGWGLIRRVFIRIWHHQALSQSRNNWKSDNIKGISFISKSVKREARIHHIKAPKAIIIAEKTICVRMLITCLNW